jgi:hypothetical protein
MKWEDIRQKYIDEWIIIEAINARTEDGNRIVEELTIVDTFDNDNNGALRKYVELHKVSPERELYVVHTSRNELNIKERRWTGVRQA